MLGLSQDQPLDCWRNIAWAVKKGQRKEILPRHRVLRPNENHIVVPELSCPKRLGIRISMISAAVVKMTNFVCTTDLCRNAQSRSATSTTTTNSQSLKTALHCLPFLKLPSVTLHVVEVTFQQVRIPLSSTFSIHPALHSGYCSTTSNAPVKRIICLPKPRSRGGAPNAHDPGCECNCVVLDSYGVVEVGGTVKSMSVRRCPAPSSIVFGCCLVVYTRIVNTLRAEAAQLPNRRAILFAVAFLA
jgi:hypothetical protein